MSEGDKRSGGAARVFFAWRRGTPAYMAGYPSAMATMRSIAVALALCVLPCSAFGALGHVNPLIMNRRHVPTVKFSRLTPSCQFAPGPGATAHPCKIPKPRLMRLPKP